MSNYINFGEQNFHGLVRLVTQNAKLPARSVDSVDHGQDRKIPPAPGTNQIAGFGSSCPLTSLEKKKKIPLINRVRGPYGKIRTEFFPVDLWPKRAARGP